MSRIDDLIDLREGLLARMAVCTSDQNYAVMGRLLADTVKQIAELDGTSAPAESKGGIVVDFAARLAGRAGSNS
ncbi:MAG: hypothetical protein H7Z19_02960 [Chitinophagaceae bacterium]|nr:hypothetical protein [Rubrivivax sp.]